MQIMKTLTVDEAFDKIGHLGYSQLIYFLTLATLQIFGCNQMLLNVFQGLEPEFKCSPIEGLKFDVINNGCFNGTKSNCILDFKDKHRSIAAEFNLVCEDKYKVALVQSLWMGGVMTGALVLGGIADQIGRLKTLMISILFTIGFEGFSAFSPNYIIFVTLRFFGGMSCALVILVSFVLSQELVGTSKRSICGIAMSTFFAIGIAQLSFASSLISSWRILGLYASLSGIIFCAIPLFMPESPRWLLGQGLVEEAQEVVENIAKKNGTFLELPTKWQLSNGDKSMKTNYKTKEKVSILRQLTKHPYIAVITAIQIFSWFVNSLVYYALTMAASDMGGNIYISTSINGLIEIPAYVATLFLIDCIGRRKSLCGFMMIGGFSCLCIQFIPPKYYLAVTGLALFGKLSIAASFSIVYIHSGEIFPTPLRNTCMGVVSVAARIGGIVSPFVLMLDDLYPKLQFTVLGFVTFFAGLLNLKLPETKGQPMPQSLADMLEFNNSTSKTHSKYMKLINESENIEIEVNSEVEEGDEEIDIFTRSEENIYEDNPVSENDKECLISDS